MNLWDCKFATNYFLQQILLVVVVQISKTEKTVQICYLLCILFSTSGNKYKCKAVTAKNIATTENRGDHHSSWQLYILTTNTSPPSILSRPLGLNINFSGYCEVFHLEKVYVVITFFLFFSWTSPPPSQDDG